ncbi:MAG: hydroxymethylbilane synthase [Flavobacteriales bacterium]|nr:hydroxymethylbilane synthase [Flavobacteriales bacterium]
MRKIIIGSRGSKLALWQANFVQEKLQQLSIDSEIKIIKTKGDAIQDLSFDKIEGKGFFTKEIESALLAKEIDLAVHSYKDLETSQPEGLSVVSVPPRAAVNDLLIIKKEAFDLKRKFGLKKDAVVGTSSARRKNLLKLFRPDLDFQDIRGNVPTRIQKLETEPLDAIILAQAGVKRLQIDLSMFQTEALEPTEFIPAPGQGALALQIRSEDEDLSNELSELNDETTFLCTKAEKDILKRFEGGCHMPLGAYCYYNEEREIYETRVSVASKWEDSPKLYYAESRSAMKTVETVMNKHQNLPVNSVFITRNTDSKDLFTRVLSEAGFSVHGKALIEMRTINYDEVPNSDWIFFSSKNAVKHFFIQQPELGNQKFAVIGKGTNEALRSFGKRADFIGYSNDTKLTGKQFSALAGGQSILFPQAKGSIKTVQHQFFNQTNVIDLNVYETILHRDYKVPNAKILIFTSPSNVNAYFNSGNKVEFTQEVIAMGHATGKALENRGVERFVYPDGFTPVCLARSVFSL